MLIGFYFVSKIDRSQFDYTLFIYTALFVGMGLIYLLYDGKLNWKWLFFGGLLLRLSLLTSVPQWSDDYARFLWDGELLNMAENPYAETPADWVENNPEKSSAYLEQLFDILNSKTYYSVYPPSNQLVFWLAAKAANGFVWNGIITLRLILIAAEVGVFLLFLRLFKAYQIPLKQLIFYWFNPFVIMEITGNLHFEGLVLFFLLFVSWALSQNRSLLSGGSWGLAIAFKLLPLMLLPSLLSFKTTRNSWRFWLGAFLVVFAGFIWLLMDQTWVNFFQSLRLYQGKFEFNASVYYLLREVGFWIEGYNPIAILTMLLSGAAFLGILWISWKRKAQNLFQLMDLWVAIYLIYLILQAVVHPWYLIPGLGLSLFSSKKTFLTWSFVAIFSYQAYSNEGFIENPIYLVLEYAIVFAAIFWDYLITTRKPLYI